MNSPATVRPPGRSRLALIVAGVLALLGSFAVTAVTITVPIPVPIAPAAATATRPIAMPAATTMGAPRAAVTGAAESRDQALSTSVAMSNANMSSGAMVTGATAVTTAIIRTGAIAVPTAIIRTGPIGGATEPIGAAMAMAVSGAAGPTATNRPPMDMKSRRGRQRRFGTGATTKPFLMATRIEMPANHGHTIQHCRHLLLDMQVCRNRCRADRWRYWRPACSDISTSVPRSREYDVGGDREPEGVIADNLYLDEHANDRKDHQHERNHKPKVHCAFLLALRRNAKNLA